MQFKHKSWENEWNFKELEKYGVVTLMPNDHSDSYGLLFNARAIITCGSTIGIEAAYHGIPCIEVGDTISVALKCAAPGNSLHSIRSFINAPFILEGAKQQAIRYASYNLNPDTVKVTLLSYTKDGCAIIDKKLASPVRCLLGKIKKWLGLSRSLLVIPPQKQRSER